MGRKDFAMLIKSIRLLLMLTQTQMASKILISPQTYKLWELAESLPTPTSLNKLINAYKTLNVPQNRINDVMVAYQDSKLCRINNIEEVTHDTNGKPNVRYMNI